MAIINYTDQLKYTGKGYLDAKMMPVETVDDLKKISLTQRFEGLTITVLNNGNPQDYWLVGGITNQCWVKKTDGDLGRIDTLEENVKNLSTKFTQLNERVIELQSDINKNTEDININKNDINTLKERIDSLRNTNVDNETIGTLEDDSKTLFVKVLNKEGNMLKKDVNENGETGLYVSIPIFLEDEEL